MKNHWLDKKKNDRPDFKFGINTQVKINVETGTITGKVIGSYRESTDMFGWNNWYIVELDKDWAGYKEFTFHEIRLDHSWDFNVMPQYHSGDEKKFDHNFKVKATEDPQVTLNADTFCVQSSLDIKLTIGMDAQHDGRPWGEDWTEKCYNRLMEEIMEDIKAQVEPFIRKIDPFQSHR